MTLVYVYMGMSAVGFIGILWGLNELRKQKKASTSE